MTRDWKSLLQESKGLLVAICISLFLHLFLLGQAYLVIPKLGDEHYQIEARLVMPKPTPQVKAVIAKPLKPVEQSQPIPEEAIQEVQESRATPKTPTSEIHEPIAETPAVRDDPGTDQSEAVAEPEPNDVGLIVNPTPYKYVETEFDVRTDLNAKVESRPVGRAKIVYERIRNGSQYQLRSLIQASGFAALVIPNLLQTSEGFLSEYGLQPQHYLYQFGNKQDKTFKADFDWESRKLAMHSAKGDKQVVLVEGAQDLLSFMYQFMFVPPLQNMQLAITNGKKLDTYDYSFEGEEVLKTRMGDVKTIHLLRTSGDDEKDELWLALDYQYVPVKIRKTEKENKVYELLATSLKTEKPPI